MALAAALALAGPSTGRAAADKTPDPGDREVCGWAASRAEAAYDIPSRLLSAISLAETGRWDGSRGYSWPWTVRAGDSGHFLAELDGAAAKIRRLQAKGVKNIDVGCMQINLMHHPDAFETLEDALDPVKNAEYAAKFLRELHSRTRSWSRAVQLYHSSSLDRGRRYWRRVAWFWQAERSGRYANAEDELRIMFRRRQAQRAAQLGFSATIGPLSTPIIRAP